MNPTPSIPTVVGSLNKVRSAVPVTGLSLKINRTITKNSPPRNSFSILFRQINLRLRLALNPIHYHDYSKSVHP